MGRIAVIFIVLAALTAPARLPGGMEIDGVAVGGAPGAAALPPKAPVAGENSLDGVERILSGAEPVPVLNSHEVKFDIHRSFSDLRHWLAREKSALQLLLCATVVSLSAGVGLALFIRRMIRRGEEQKRRMHWQFIGALYAPVIIMTVSWVIFAFTTPILHSVPELYPLDARLFFTWVTILAAWTGFKLIMFFDSRIHAFAKRPDNNLDALMVDITRKVLILMLILLTALFIGQTIFRLNITTLLAGAGVVGLAVAFASRETLSNFFGTMVIILDRPFRCGDRIRTGEVNGIVQAVGMRSTRIRTDGETTISIPNSRLAEQPIENISRLGVIRFAFTVGLVYDTAPENIELAMKLLHGIVDNFKSQDSQQYRPRIFLDTLGESAINLKVVMWLKTTSFDVEETMRTEINLALVRQFQENHIVMAYPTVTNCLTGEVRLVR